jgi:signal transduction histidine kinase
MTIRAGRLSQALVNAPLALSRTARDLRFLTVGVPLHLVTAALWFGLALSLARLPPVAPLPVPLMVAAVAPLTHAERWRHRVLRGVALPRAPAPDRDRRPLAWARSPDTWRRIAYHCAVGPVLAAAELVVLGLLVGGGVGVTIYGWIWALPSSWRFNHPGYTTAAMYITVGAMLALGGASWLTGAVASLEVHLGRALLGPGRAGELARRVEDLTESRAGVIDAADAERRRIERDLHDGAQQRLVSLAVNLGLAKATLADVPEDARKVIDEAHREAKEALAELSSLVRGLHPAVLTDLGLDAALSGLAVRTPIPVRVRVAVDQRPSPAAESVAYFMVAEALTNITKHARASRAEVTVERTGALLVVTVTDDGAGGADMSAGTGLSGLAKRARSVDGALRILSPVGGPTTLTLMVPCEP